MNTLLCGTNLVVIFLTVKLNFTNFGITICRFRCSNKETDNPYIQIILKIAHKIYIPLSPFDLSVRCGLKAAS